MPVIKYAKRIRDQDTNVTTNDGLEEKSDGQTPSSDPSVKSRRVSISTHASNDQSTPTQGSEAIEQEASHAENTTDTVGSYDHQSVNSLPVSSYYTSNSATTSSSSMSEPNRYYSTHNDTGGSALSGSAPIVDTRPNSNEYNVRRTGPRIMTAAQLRSHAPFRLPLQGLLDDPHTSMHPRASSLSARTMSTDEGTSPSGRSGGARRVDTNARAAHNQRERDRSRRISEFIKLLRDVLSDLGLESRIDSKQATLETVYNLIKQNLQYLKQRVASPDEVNESSGQSEAKAMARDWAKLVMNTTNIACGLIDQYGIMEITNPAMEKLRVGNSNSHAQFGIQGVSIFDICIPPNHANIGEMLKSISSNSEQKSATPSAVKTAIVSLLPNHEKGQREVHPAFLAIDSRATQIDDLRHPLWLVFITPMQPMGESPLSDFGLSSGVQSSGRSIAPSSQVPSMPFYPHPHATMNQNSLQAHAFANPTLWNMSGAYPPGAVPPGVSWQPQFLSGQSGAQGWMPHNMLTNKTITPHGNGTNPPSNMATLYNGALHVPGVVGPASSSVQQPTGNGNG